jgi:putative membrane protein
MDILINANNTVSEACELAQAKSSNEAVKAYARTVNKHHTDVTKSVNELAARLKTMPEDNPVSREWEATRDKNILKLRNWNGKAFDKAYIDRDVRLHQNRLDMIDSELMRTATNEELNALLYVLFAPFSEHLAHAQKIQESLK